MIRHFGALIPATNTTVEIEYNRLLPESLQVHVARLGKGVDKPFLPSRSEDIDYQARMLGAAKVEVVCLTQTSASLFDDDYDETVTARISEGAGVPALTSAAAIGLAARALDVKRIALVSPYSGSVVERAKDYFESKHGLKVAGMEGFGATDAYAIGSLDAGHAAGAFERIDRPEVEALVVPGGNFPTMKFIAEWEDRFRKPVITTNQAALWAALRVMKIDEPLDGLGRLLKQMPAG